jgi:hypothetical protein
MFSHFDAPRLEKVTIVDPDAMALARYRELMTPKIAASAKWGYFSSFDEYVRHEVS